MDSLHGIPPYKFFSTLCLIYGSSMPYRYTQTGKMQGTVWPGTTWIYWNDKQVSDKRVSDLVILS